MLLLIMDARPPPGLEPRIPLCLSPNISTTTYLRMLPRKAHTEPCFRPRLQESYRWWNNPS